MHHFISKLYLNSFISLVNNIVSMSTYFIWMSFSIHLQLPHCRGLQFWAINHERQLCAFNIRKKKKNLHNPVSSTDTWLPAPRSFWGELFDHNFSRLDSPEIKSASWTARGGANIPVHFFIDLHSFPSLPPPHSPRLLPRLNPPPPGAIYSSFPSCLRCPDLQWSPGLRLMMSCAIFIISAFEISG